MAQLINLDRAREQMARESLDALILVTPINTAYAAGTASEFLLGRFEDWTTAVVLARDADIAPALIIPEFDLPYLIEQPSWIEDVQLFGSPWSSVGVFMGETLERGLSNDLRVGLAEARARFGPGQQGSFLDGLTKALRDRGLDGAKLAIDDLRLGRKLEEAGIGQAQIGDAVQLMRRIRIVKTPAEVDLITAGADINAKALAAVIAEGAAGTPEDELIRVYRKTLVDHDARWLGERGMMFGTGDASTLSLPASSERALTPGDAVVLDCLGTYQGYHMDLARTAVVGEPTADQKLRYRAAVDALEAVEDAMRPGVHTEDLRELTRATVAKHGLRRELVSVTTHGIGFEVFEFPHENSLVEGYPLELGMVVNTEVFYRDPDLGAFHLEDSVLVESDGCRILRPVDRDLVVFQ
ncbi:MAG: Xaa-Pro peptidase family protein [Pseudomonadota bacterium]